MTPDVHFEASPGNPKRQVVTFSPPVASWSFPDPEHTLDEMWAQLVAGSSALAMEHVNDDFEETRKKMKVRILSILIFWKAKEWVVFEPSKDAVAPAPELPPQSA